MSQKIKHTCPECGCEDCVEISWATSGDCGTEARTPTTINPEVCDECGEGLDRVEILEAAEKINWEENELE